MIEAALVSGLAWVGLSICESLIGWGSEQIADSTVKKLKNSLFRPENHDIRKGLFKSLFRATKDLLADLQDVNPFPNQDELVLGCKQAVDWQGNSLEELSPATNKMISVINDNMTGLHQHDDSQSTQLARSEVEQLLVTAVLGWLAEETGDTIPESIKALFENGGTINGKTIRPWVDRLRDYLGEEIKTNERFFSICVYSAVSKTSCMVEANSKNLGDVKTMLQAILSNRWHHLFDEAIVDVEHSGNFLLKPSDTRVAVLESTPLDQIKVGQRFQIEFELPWMGDAILLQRYDGRWYPTPVQRPNGMCRRYLMGPARFPFDDFLFEENASHVGNRLFVVILSKKPIPEEILVPIRSRQILDEMDRSALASFLLRNGEDEVQLFSSECRFVLDN
jgi:hypothetical protein